MSKIMEDVIQEARREERLLVSIEDVRAGIVTPEQALKRLKGMSLEEFGKEIDRFEEKLKKETEIREEAVMNALKRGRKPEEITEALRFDMSFVKKVEKDIERLYSRFEGLKNGRSTPWWCAETVGLSTSDFLREMKDWEAQQEAKAHE